MKNILKNHLFTMTTSSWAKNFGYKWLAISSLVSQSNWSSGFCSFEGDYPPWDLNYFSWTSRIIFTFVEILARFHFVYLFILWSAGWASTSHQWLVLLTIDTLRPLIRFFWTITKFLLAFSNLFFNLATI